MKKLLISLIIMSAALFSPPAHSQVTNTKTASGITANLVSSTYGAVTDTLSNATTHYLVFPAASTGYYPSGWFRTAEFTLTSTALSGTTSLADTLQHSVDGVNWFSIPTDSTFAVSTGLKTVGWKWTDYGDGYVRLKSTGAGTQSTKLQGVFILRREIVTQQ